MKALTDKIIEALEKRANEQFNVTVRAELNRAIEEIKVIEEGAEFDEVARVMMKHLGIRTDLYCPHHTVIITNTTAELVQGQKTVGLVTDYIPD